jgi:anti-anti-sigma factor
MEAGLEIDISADRPTSLTVRLSGELDLAARPAVVERVSTSLAEKSDVERVVIDLGRVRFCDSSGLGALLDIRRLAGRYGTELVLHSPSPSVARVLDIAGLDDLLPRD